MDGQHAAKLLQSAEQDSQQMVQTSGSPRGFTTTLVAVSAVVLTLFQAYPPQAFWTALLYIPLILWYVLARRRRAKPRTLADTPSLLAGAYAGYFFLGILLVNCLRFWEAAQAASANCSGVWGAPLKLIAPAASNSASQSML